MPDYSKGKIYIVRSPHTEEVYIGSTISTLSKRMGQHREKYNKWKKGEHHYFTCFKLIDLGDAYIELIEEYPCENKNQLERREGEIMRQTEHCVNKQIAGRTKDEYYDDNRDRIINQVKEYRINNLELDKQRHKNKYERNNEKILRKQKERYKENKEEILKKQKDYNEANKDAIRQRNKQYRETNKELIKQRKRAYYEGNKERILAKQKEKKQREETNII